LSYRAAIDLLGTHYALSTEISRVLMSEGLYDPAEILLKFAVDDQPELPLGYALLALVKAERGDAEAAERFARQSLAIEPADPTRMHLLAWALAAQGRIDEAREARGRAEEIGQALFWQQYMYHAHVRWADGDTTGALVALDSATSVVTSDLGKATLDSVRVNEFGLEPRLPAPSGSIGTPR
ncbi:MAG: tetratricopeptide repeat protein, partial [Gemmatimonadetes bacterium]|nr:tetratricopeptide repeat protein [Gemmatimonadota bacterium]